MDDYLEIQLLSSGVFLLGNLFPALGAYFLARRFAGNSVPQKIALTMFLYFAQCAAVFSILGAAGRLTASNGFAAAAASGLLFSAAARFLPGGRRTDPVLRENPCRTERFLTIAVFLVFVLCAAKTSILPGTDTYLYHLYYPAMWILYGKIFPVSIAGLSNEYFPVPGETLYGWLMMSGTDTPFLPLLQLAALLMAVCAAAGLWSFYRIPSLHVKAGMLLTIMTGITLENACLCYTDGLTGSFLAAGVCFLIPVLDGKYSSRGERFFFSAVSGVSLGLAASMKYSGLVLSPVITLMILVWFGIRRKESPACPFLTALSAVFTAGCYYFPNLLRTGNPFYPVKIPFLFPRGIDFDRPPVPPGKLWDFLVSDNPWDMNEVSAVVFILLAAGAVCAAAIRREKERELSLLTGGLAAVFAVSGVIMLLVFPSTQARQAVPFLSVFSILFAPVLYFAADRFCGNRVRRIAFGTFISVLGILMARNGYSLKYFIFAAVLSAAAFCLSLGKSAGWYRGVFSFLVLTGFILLFYYCHIRWPNALNNFQAFAGETAVQCTAELRRNYQNGAPHKIASVGSWYNYMLMMDMPGNEVRYVPVNRKNTTHPHELDSIEELRDDPVPFEVWLGRLRSGGFTHLIVDLAAHQDFPRNKEVELKWAVSHPENFELICSGNQIYFFRIKR